MNIMRSLNFSSSPSRGASEMSHILASLDHVMAIIEFKPDGTILTANKNFLSTVGYTLNEIAGKHHSMFAEPSYAKSAEYREFWADLSNGNYKAAEFKRFGKGGKEIWIEASYNPILGRNGRPYKIIKFATNITEKKLLSADNQGKIDAILRSQAMIEFEMDGKIIFANENFLNVMGYQLEEIVGKHHSMFAEPQFASSPEYKKFWEELRSGKFQAAQYKRLGKGGKEVWIEASYNPIFDATGKPFKVVKFATDLTPRKNENLLLADNFEKNVQSLVQIVASSATEMQATAQNLAAASEETSVQSSVVASATEQLATSVNEIAGQVAGSVHVVNAAVEEAKQSEALVSGLLAAATKIGEVTSLISDIAEQTNLLALNATIEAARAGDAGKGFAVVASEVKNLATETTKATEEISQQIRDIQTASQNTAEGIKKITSVISEVNEISSTISSAVEEQSAATSEVSSNIVGVQTAANETGESSLIMLDVAKDLSERSEELQSRVNEFLLNVRAM